MKEKSIKRLLEVMLENQCLFRSGLCSWSTRLYQHGFITLIELAVIDSYILENRPSRWSSVSAFRSRSSSYYWAKGDIKPRVSWLKKHIMKQSV